MDRTLYVDLRCLQDINYRVRGIGHHLAALLRARAKSDLSNWKTIGLIDPRSPKLPLACSSLADVVTSSVNPCYDSAPAVFIDGTPMTHDTRFSLRLVGHPGFFSAAVVYDFIPLDWPGYLPTVPKRIEYVAKLARLRNFDLFFPISEYTGRRLSQVLGAPRHKIHKTGASVRRSVYEHSERWGSNSSPYNGKDDPYFVILAADPRKNPQVAIEAIRQLNLVYPRRIALKVVGHYQDPYKYELLKLAGHPEGAGFLEFCPEISDEDLVALYRGAIATIISSHIEGFSLPVVEASVCRCPVIASTCAAHLELINRPEALFQSTNAAALAEKLEALLTYPSLRASLLASQAHLGAKFHEDVVGQQFWGGIETAIEKQSKAVSAAKRRMPRLAFLSPYPPDESDAAFYTAMVMEAGKIFFHSDLYTDSVRPLVSEETFCDAGTVTLAPILNKNYNGVISVLGNSSSYAGIFEVFERFGGPCILHDVRLANAYFERLGPQTFLAFAAELLRRSVSMDEVTTWLQDTNPPSLFIERILERASPLMVHTAVQQALIKQRYGIDAHVITSCPAVFLTGEELTAQSKQSTRDRLNITSGVFAISSFGEPTRAKGMDTCIMAIDFLRSWNIPAQLYFVGDSARERAEIDRISTIYDVAEYVHTRGGLKDSSTYRDFLIASDAAVQLRSYDFGKPSTTVSDCIGAGLSCVATDDMVASCDGPPYVTSVPDHFSPLHVAEQLALMWESQSFRRDYKEERIAYIKTHNFAYYSSRLMEILGIA